MFCQKGVFRNLTKFRGKHLCQSLFLIEQQAFKKGCIGNKWVKCENLLHNIATCNILTVYSTNLVIYENPFPGVHLDDSFDGLSPAEDFDLVSLTTSTTVFFVFLVLDFLFINWQILSFGFTRHWSCWRLLFASFPNPITIKSIPLFKIRCEIWNFDSSSSTPNVKRSISCFLS